MRLVFFAFIVVMGGYSTGSLSKNFQLYSQLEGGIARWANKGVLVMNMPRGGEDLLIGYEIEPSSLPKDVSNVVWAIGLKLIEPADGNSTSGVVEILDIATHQPLSKIPQEGTWSMGDEDQSIVEFDLADNHKVIITFAFNELESTGIISDIEIIITGKMITSINGEPSTTEEWTFPVRLDFNALFRHDDTRAENLAHRLFKSNTDSDHPDRPPSDE